MGGQPPPVGRRMPALSGGLPYPGCAFQHRRADEVKICEVYFADGDFQVGTLQLGHLDSSGAQPNAAALIQQPKPTARG